MRAVTKWNVSMKKLLLCGAALLFVSTCAEAQKQVQFAGFWGSYQPEVKQQVDTYICITKLDPEHYGVLWANISKTYPSTTFSIATLTKDGRLKFKQHKTMTFLEYVAVAGRESLLIYGADRFAYSEFARIERIPVNFLTYTD
jgi:hypothetical protein